jgi:hypothetical protein
MNIYLIITSKPNNSESANMNKENPIVHLYL